ncbi:alpha/beta hydrolase [Mycobacterium colombiense]|uniref:alpha/beta hydrolase n=1 Tax=Mycobacterium colombiense TaxID=339268 RepID=UPI00200AB0C6|nr:esterase [Mycobacterium colombiense]MCK8644288.1 esterase [Mycobacterium colombiense]
MRTVEYAPGRWADVFGEPAPSTILLWHGAQTDARAAVGPLAGMLAGRSAVVVAPDWNSHAEDCGRADLLRSLEFTRNLAVDAGRILLVGWSMGGAAAAGVTLHAAQFDFTPAHTVCLAGAFMVPDPISGALLTDGLSDAEVRSPFSLLHGLDDDVVPVDASRDFAARLERVGWPVEVVELDADHGSIAGADYDALADRYEPAKGGPARIVAQQVAGRIAAMLGG